MRAELLARIGPGLLSGITLGRWLRILSENRFAVDLPYLGRAATITSGSIQNSLFGGWEALRYGRRVRAAKVHPPLFILGIWRSGTTHLHYLFAQDDRFAYPNNYQVSFPRTFLTMERASFGVHPKVHAQEVARKITWQWTYARLRRTNSRSAR